MTRDGSSPEPDRNPRPRTEDSALYDAVTIATEALEERARASRLMLTDRTLYGLADPDLLQSSLARDEGAATLLRAATSQGFSGALRGETPGQ